MHESVACECSASLCASHAGLFGGGPGEHPRGAFEASLPVPDDGGARRAARRGLLRVQAIRPDHSLLGRPRQTRRVRLPPRHTLQAAHLASGQLGEVAVLSLDSLSSCRMR